MPPVVTGAVVAVIGLNLAAIPVKNMAANNFESWMQALTFVCVGLVAVFTRGMVQRLLILVDRKSTRLNSSHLVISYAVFCLKKNSDEIVGDEHSGLKSARSFASAAWGVAVADVSMSLDNVLAVAGAAKDHPWVLVFGLILSVILMGIAANVIARYIKPYRWIPWAGLIACLWARVRATWPAPV